MAVPTISISAPTAAKNFGAPATVTLTATATPSSGTTITKVDFFISGVTLPVGTVNGATNPHTFVWNNVAIGNYSLTAKATDTAGGTKTSTAVAFTVKANVVPAVSITSPAANAVFAAGSTIPLTATATDTDGTISSVQFFRGGSTSIGTVTASPYTFNWTSVPAATSYSLTATATDNSNGTKTSTAIVISVKTPPTVSITAPVNGATFAAGSTITVSASAGATTPATVSKVQFLRDGVALNAADTASPYTTTWTNATAGAHVFTATVTDSATLSVTSTSVNVTVTPPPPPTVSLTVPANGANFATGSTITLTAIAAATTPATVSKVQFLRNGAAFGTADTTSPYSIATWTNAAAGTYILAATATDTTPQSTTSAPITITVGTPPPTVSITAPANGAIFTAGANITISATTSPATVTNVQFLRNAANQGAADTTSPYSTIWTNATAGSYTLTAKATNGSASATSAPINITVAAPHTLPTASITQPISGSTFTAPATIDISATASTTQSGATIKRVDFYNGSTLIGSAPSAPYMFSWTNRPAGGYLLKAVAVDDSDFSGPSALVYAAVDGADSCTTTPPLASAERATQLAEVANAALTFEANAGQANKDVRYQLRGRDYQLFLTSTESVLALHPHAKDGKSVAVRMKFLGANPDPLITGLEPVERKSNYLIGNDRNSWHTNVPNFSRVRYEALYPGIDEVYYASQGRLEYDLVVAAGADPGSIRFTIDGADRLSVGEDGSLRLQTSLGTVIQKRPAAYQDIDGKRRIVEAKYQLLAANEVSFQLGDYDARHTLVIDPVLVYSTYLGGAPDASSATTIAISRCGEAFVAGWTWATAFPTTAGAFDSTAVPQTEMGFASKLNQAGTALLYSTYVTGTGVQTTYVSKIAVDATGHAFIGGQTQSTDFPVTPGALSTTMPASGNSWFLGKLNSDGSAFLFATYLPGAFDVGGLAVDAAGSAYVVTTGNVWKLNATGSATVYTYALGATGATEHGNAIAVDASGNAYVAGTTFSSDTPVTPGAFQVVRPNGSAFVSTGFVAKINPTGTNRVFGTFLGTTGTTALNGLAIDSANNVYVTGSTDGAAIPGTVTASPTFTVDPIQSATVWSFAAKLRADGSALDFFSRFGGLFCPDLTHCCPNATYCSASSSSGLAVAVDQASNVWFAGISKSNRLPLVKPLYSAINTQAVSNYIFVTKLSPSGTSVLLSTLLDGSTAGTAAPNTRASAFGGIQVDAIGSVYIAGSTDKIDFPTTTGAFQASLPSAFTGHAFVTKINDSKDPIVTLGASPSSGVVGSATTLTATVTGNSPAGTVTFLDGTSVIGSTALSGTTAQMVTSSLAAGLRALTARYEGDARNNVVTSPVVSYNVSNPNGFPTITLSGTITDGMTLTADASSGYYSGGVVYVSAAAPGNILVNVTVYIDGASYPFVPNAPVLAGGFGIPSLSVGVHLMYGIATDNFGHSTVSAPFRFVVNAATGVPPASITITSPTTGSTFALPATVSMQASAGASTASVSYYANAILVASSATAPLFSGVWQPSSGGTYSIVAIATSTSAAGAYKISAPITVTITAPPPPTISITAPLNGSSFATNVTTNIVATADASSGATIKRVDFYSDSVLLGTSSVPPYSYAWSTATAGTHSLTAKATDTRDAFTISAAVSVTATAPQGPAVSIASPLSGSSYATPANVPLSATATGVNGSTVVSIEFYAGPMLVGVGSPAVWNALGGGTFSLTARATDNLGAVGISAPVMVTIVGDPNETITFLTNDFAGNPIIGTDALGAVKWKENYKPFGGRVSFDANAASNHQWFGGKYQDNESGMSYFGARYYDPVVGRFMGIDPVGFDPATPESFNCFAYANNNPYRFKDPDGRLTVPALIVIGGVLVFAALPPEKQKELGQSALNGFRALIQGIKDIVTQASGEDGNDKSSGPKPTPNFQPPTNPPQEPKIPEGWVPRPGRDGGTVWQPPGLVSPGPGIRVMPPTEQYPNGYWVPTNPSGQPIDPSTGRTGTRPQTHVPLPAPKPDTQE